MRPGAMMGVAARCDLSAPRTFAHWPLPEGLPKVAFWGILMSLTCASPAHIPVSTPRVFAVESKHLFEILVREHIDSVRAFLLSSLRDPAHVEDLVQEAFLVAWRNLARYDRALPFGPWVRGIASRLLWNHRRKEGRHKVQYVEDSELRAIETRFDRFGLVPGDTFEERLEALRVGMNRLTDSQREAITLHYQHGMQCREIAERLGIGNEAVKKHLQRGRAALLRAIDDKLEASNQEPIRREAQA